MLEPLQFISASAINAGIVCVPALMYAAVKRSKPIVAATLITFVLFMVQSVVLSVPNFGLLTMLKMNWMQKFAMIVIIVLAARVMRVRDEEWGFRLPTNIRQAVFLALILGFVTSIPSFIEILSAHDFSKFNLEYFLFELTMPGLHEEPFYRGLILLIWDRAAGRPFKFLGVKVGIGALVSSLLFVLGHTFLLDHDFHPVIAPFWTWLDLGFFCLAMIWLRYKYDSFWPAIGAHNLGNSASHLLAVFHP